ncbi:glycerol-3-phosphate dehydrogenase, mitochondrial-like [Paramacrobiotus metropolitanus]|uniref:glycerol-3-phosphate dehydrogenase, mitochondrial-like n=1 Tax=Paramacrobiotus metropolitanus TaxID=2943436 RepID=UPI002445E26F|nr:glycerol-3-phosphate dehydrogenase, mitochondrial-like [Paramacrobiotus metropolitanus]
MPIISSIIKTAAVAAAAVGSSFLGLTSYKIYDLKKYSSVRLANGAHLKTPDYLERLPTREGQLTFLEDTPEYDVLVIGGGATGCGVALDAVSRGLKTALVERGDFASQTSSKSTKLIHGGVRYLQAAILGFDLQQYNMVKEALRERSNFLSIAPHLTRALPILLPLRDWWDIPYMWVGIKLYDMISGDSVLRHSYYVCKERVMEAFPQLREEPVRAGLVYFDGQQNDARMCLALAITAARMGANVANYLQVVNLVKLRDGWREFVRGVVVKDVLTNREFAIRAKCVINATGPFTDEIRQIDNAAAEPICMPSAGIHIALPAYYCPRHLGLISTKTSDGRVIFVLPWEGITLAGTTDTPTDVTSEPTPTEREIDFVLKECQELLKSSIDRSDILSVWSGIRPLVRNPHCKDTKSLARTHIVEVSPSQLITIAGGKWTTYRAMAEETVDRAVAECNLKPANSFSQTLGLPLEGAHEYEPHYFVRLVKSYGVDYDVAKHLAHQYGDQSEEVLKLAEVTGKAWPLTGIRLVEHFPYLEAEVRYAVRQHYAVHLTDVIARRMRLAFQDVHATRQVLPRIVEIMGQELKWTDEEKHRQIEAAEDFLERQMGHSTLHHEHSVLPSPREAVAHCIERYQAAEKKPGSGISHKRLLALLQELQLGEVDEEQLLTLLKHIKALHRNKLVSLMEFLALAAEIRRLQEFAAQEERRKHWPHKT